MNEVKTIDLVVIGGGSAGLAAAISAKNEGIDDILIIEKEEFLGGILQQCIHNGFGLQTFNEQLSGPEYAQRYINEVERLKIKYITNAFVSSISKDKDVYYSSKSEGFVHIKAKAIIISTGCVERTPGQIMLEGKRISGILTAGQAQKYMNIEGYMVSKKAFILGSGDIGLIMARRMTLEGAKVLGVAELMPYSNGLARNIAQCLNDFNIPLFLSHTIKDVIGKDRVEKIIIAKVDEKGNYIENSEKEFEVDTLILSVGLIPYNVLLEGIDAKISSTKGAIVDENYMTSIPGIFECGNSLHVHDLVDYVSLEAKQAGVGASLYLKNMLNSDNDNCQVKCGNNISYIVPQHINVNNIKKDISFKYRVRKPMKNVKVEAYLDDKLIKSISKIAILPSEMEKMTFNKEALANGRELRFEVKEVKL